MKLMAPSKPVGMWSEQNLNYKKRNEDGASAGLVLSSSGKKVIFAAVADGVSGLPNGDAASRLAVEWPRSFIPAANFNSTGDFVEILKVEFQNLNNSVCALPGGAGSTLTVVFLFGSDIIIVHIGDTTCFYFTFNDDGDPCSITLTRSDSVVGQASASGLPDEELELMHQHALAKSLGDCNVEPSIIVNPVGLNLNRGYLLLTTDGITDVWSPSEILLEMNEVKDLNETCKRLCTLALQRRKKNQRPNRDNITCALVELENIFRDSDSYTFFAGSAFENRVNLPIRGNNHVVQGRYLRAVIFMILVAVLFWYVVLPYIGREPVGDSPLPANQLGITGRPTQGSIDKTRSGEGSGSEIRLDLPLGASTNPRNATEPDVDLTAVPHKIEGQNLNKNVDDKQAEQKKEIEKRKLKDPKNGSI